MTEIVWNIEGETYVLIITIIFWVGWAIVLISTFLISHFHLFGEGAIAALKFHLSGQFLEVGLRTRFGTP